MALTPKQENFCLVYLETGNASEAYRRAYNTAKMKASSINVNASKLLADAKIAQRLEELRKPIIKRHETTVDDLIAELEEARKLALSMAASAPAVSATMGKARILGMDRQVIDHKVQVVDDGSNQW
jgi:phage terminase small subunit